MDSLIGYGSDDEVEDRYGSYQSVEAGGAPRRREDDTNYDDVNMDMSEESGGESEPELPPADAAPRDRAERPSAESRERSDRRRRESPRRERERRSPRRDDRHRAERGARGARAEREARRGLLGDRPDERHADHKVPALMDLKPFAAGPPAADNKSLDARDAVSPRFSERDRRDRDNKERDRDRDHRHSRHSEERRAARGERLAERRSRSRSRGAAHPPPAHAASCSGEGRSPGEYRPSSYKVNKKLYVMEKMGLQIKTPAGTMASARELRAAADRPRPAAPRAAAVLDQVQKRKLLWSNKNKNEQEEAAKWSGARFAQDSDGRQVSKFMRLMGIKEPAAVKPEADSAADPIKKQEELFQAMQAQYEVARATTHTMRGVGLGFTRGSY